MYATFRKIRLKPGSAAEVGALIEAEYLPLIDDVPGFVSYTLLDLGGDEITSIGVFESQAAAEEANARAQAWTAERLKPLAAAPLEATEGTVLVHR